jgi:hypothetical protein
VFSDHINLKYWQKISSHVTREVLELLEYDLEIHHIKGTANGRADTLSRQLNYDRGKQDNENVTVLPDHLFIRALSTQHRGMPKHPDCILMVNKMTPTNPSDAQDEAIICPWVDPHKLKKIDRIWYNEQQRVVTKGSNKKQMIAKAHHDPPMYGHPGTNKTIKLVKQNYWWLTLRQDVTTYIARVCRMSAAQSQQSPDKGSTATYLSKIRSYAI